ncbi:MAG: 50S ribosomal protein L5 [Eubacteriales bacterium]|nr:50S ribosomal protein L5 [Eubacteriales bacterium]MDD4323281.1 50S ribosomal protein L5 [Eubacteriales bacterium]MDD4540986.1 50S ribosomal protein L5 [Eubacteriales bacterium]
MNRVEERYKEEIVPALMKQFNYSSVMEVPKLSKIVLNMGVGDAKEDSKAIDNAIEDLSTIAGQKAVVTYAKKSIANFKLRAGMPIGAKVTLRGDRMYYFFDKLISVALPRVRDFRGINPNSFDGHGNFTLGAREQLIFPEIDYDSIDKIRGLDIVIVTTAKTDEEGKALLDALGMPFRK